MSSSSTTPVLIVFLTLVSLCIIYLSNKYLHHRTESLQFQNQQQLHRLSVTEPRTASSQQHQLPVTAPPRETRIESKKAIASEPLNSLDPGPFRHELHDTSVNRNLRLLYEISSIDRGERIVLGARNPWTKQGGSKVHTILALVDEARQFCEYGHSVTIALVTAWRLDEEPSIGQALNDRLYCQRTAPEPMGLVVWDHYNRTIKGAFSAKHRVLVTEHLDQFDLFVHVEDDVRMTLANVHAFLDHSARLRAAHLEDKYFLGFTRYEVNVTGRHNNADPDEHFVWEPAFRFSPSHFRIVTVYGEPYLLLDGANPHQACWVATRDQLLHLNRTCRQPFLLQDHQATNNLQHVEHWSGALQIFHACGRKKLIPLLDFDRFTVAHLTMNKLTYAHILKDAVPIRVFLRRIIENHQQWTSLT